MWILGLKGLRLSDFRTETFFLSCQLSHSLLRLGRLGQKPTILYLSFYFRHGAESRTIRSLVLIADSFMGKVFCGNVRSTAFI